MSAPSGDLSGQAARGSVVSDRAARQAQRGHTAAPVSPALAAAPKPTGDTVPELRQQLDGLILRINQASGQLPPLGVVLARAITDSVTRVLRAGDVDIVARVALHGVLTDYLPGAISTYAAAVRAAATTGQLPSPAAFVEQMVNLRTSVVELEQAAARRDGQALAVHQRFLEDKFGGDQGLRL